MSDIIALWSSHYSYTEAILTFEEAGKTEVGNPSSIIDLAREHHLKQVVVCDSRIDGFLEAYKHLSKPFKATPPKPLSDYIRDEQGDKKKPNEEDQANAQKALDKATVKYEREKLWSTEPIQLLYGVKMVVCADMTIKDDASLRTESKIIIFIKNTQGYSDLIKLYNRAWTDGFYYQGRLDWALLKRFWTPNLMLALPFFSSFIKVNTLSFSSIVPEFPCPSSEIWCLKEVDSGLPFVPLIENALHEFVTQNGAQIQEVKSIYYARPEDFMAYQTFRAIGEHGEYSAPNVSHLASDRFSFAAYREVAR